MAFTSSFLLTWIDVEEAIRSRQGEWPNGMRSIRAYFDGLDIYAEAESVPKIKERLRDWLPGHVDFNEGNIRLEGEERFLPFRFLNEEGWESPARPSFVCQRPGHLDEYPKLDPEAPPILGFHSFKGGVGRTLHLLALWKALAEQEKSLLVIDLDLEAPGLTWWLRAGESEAVDQLSILDFLRLVHGDGISVACEVAAKFIRRERLPRASKNFHYFLPAFRDIKNSFVPEILPQQLSSGSLTPWILVDALLEFAKRLKVDGILIDLRAGISESSSPILLDPRVRAVFVTTLSGQSLKGTEAVYRHRQNSLPKSEDYPAPRVIVSMRPLKRPDLDLTLADFRLALGGAKEESEPDEVVETPFVEELLVVKDFDDACLLLERLEFGKDIAKELFPPSSASSKIDDEARKKLAETARRLEFAEDAPGDAFLRTPALLALADDFVERLPQAVVVGAKGSGKTFTFLQLARMKYWGEFVKELYGGTAPQKGLILPVLSPKHLSQGQEEWVKSCRASFEKELGVTLGPLPEPPREGVFNWEACFSLLLGLDGLAEINQLAKSKNCKILLTIDGLEEFFPDIHSSKDSQQSLRSLLQDVIPKFREFSSVGLVCFVREDLVRASITQNVEQFLRRYEKYRLNWTPREALQLAYWVCGQAELDFAKEVEVQSFSTEEARERLVPLWGRKLGGPNSKEADSARWVLSALSDFQSRIQARDLVRLIRLAAEKSRGNPLADRYLAPHAIRQSLEETGKEKIKEIKQENPNLNPILEKLERNQEEASVPFQAGQFGLSEDEVQRLLAAGLLTRDSEGYFFPEVIRQGLGIRSSRAGRRKVLTLLPRLL